MSFIDIQPGTSFARFFSDNLHVDGRKFMEHVAPGKIDQHESTISPFGEVKFSKRTQGVPVIARYVIDDGPFGFKLYFLQELKPGMSSEADDVMGYQGILHSLCFKEWEGRKVFPNTVEAVTWGPEHLILTYDPNPDVRTYVGNDLELAVATHREGIELMVDFQAAMTLNQLRLRKKVFRGQEISAYFDPESIDWFMQNRIKGYLAKISGDEILAEELVNPRYGLGSGISKALYFQLPGRDLETVVHGDYTDTNVHVGEDLRLLDFGSVRRAHWVWDLAAWNSSPAFQKLNGDARKEFEQELRKWKGELPVDAMLEGSEQRYAMASLVHNLRRLAYPGDNKELYGSQVRKSLRAIAHPYVRERIRRMSST